MFILVKSKVIRKDITLIILVIFVNHYFNALLFNDLSLLILIQQSIEKCA